MAKPISLRLLERKARAIYISSYIPRKCGIATYTKDLTNSANVLNPYNLAEIMAVNENGDSRQYPWEVKFRIRALDLQTFLDAAKYINQSGAEVVHLQHEFGLYGGSGGDYILNLAEHIKKPLVTTFHTVLDNPTANQERIIKGLALKSKAVTVMVKVAARRLNNIYKIPSSKIIVIPHGVPDVAYGGTEKFKELINLSERPLMGAINLLSSNKGLEYAILAVKEIRKKFPKFLFLIIGETHPEVKKFEGEKYRQFLEKIVLKEKLQNNVRFINEYISLESLTNYLGAMDVYITPYLDSGQTASGTLAYAVGAGKSCISTPYLYAKEVLAHGRGRLVPFKDEKAIAKEVIAILNNPKEREEMQKKAYDFGRTMIWPNVALRHLDLYELILKKAKK